VDAFQRYDIDQLVALLHDDAVMSMPPISMWLRGAKTIGTWMGLPGPSQCRGSILVPAGQVNGVQSWAQYKPSPDGGYSAWALLVHEASGGRFTRWTFFLDTPRLFPELGLAAHLP
jgi:RNA polymerase sigma-70 factor (ECF subfamily)